MLVEEYGGYKRVSADRAWKRIAERFDLPSTCTNAAFVLKQSYIKYILDLFPDQSADLQQSKTTSKTTASPQQRRSETTERQELSLSTTGWTAENWKRRIRLLRALECGLPDELNWALDELLKMSSSDTNGVFYFYSIPGISSILLELFIQLMEGEVGRSDWQLVNLKRILIILWNCCYGNPRNSQFVVLNSRDLLNESLALGIRSFELFTSLNLFPTLLGLLECFCKEQIFIIDERLGIELQAFFTSSLHSPDRHIRLSAISLMKETFGNTPNAQWSWSMFGESLLGEAVLFNALIQDDFIQIAIVDYLFNLTDSLECFGSNSTIESTFSPSKESFCLVVDILFHIIFDNFSFAKHLRNISYKTVLKDPRLSTGQVLSKWLLLCYVPSKIGTSLISLVDIYNQFEMFCAREGLSNGLIDYSQFLVKLNELFPKCIVNPSSTTLVGQTNPSGQIAYAALKARDWNERPVKTTEKVINAILTLRNFAILPLPAEFVGSAFLPHWDSICQLSIQPDSNGNFIAKHFGLILCELFCREIFFDSNLLNKS